jgi:hypothetical protein
VKTVYVALLSLVQAFWMALFVKHVCAFPGHFHFQFVALFGATFAISCICLAISAASAGPERASLLSIYLVGLQLPLSGAVLALPSWVTNVTQPLISAYWGWSAYLRSFQDFRHYDVVRSATKTAIANLQPAVLVLTAQSFIAIVLASLLLDRARRRGSE